MNRTKSAFIIALIVGLLLTLASCVAKTPPAPPSDLAQGSTQPFERIVARFLTVNGPADFHNPLHIAIPTTSLTATPGVMVVNAGVGRAQEWRNAAGTPVAGINADGSVVFAGSITSAGAVNGGGVLGASFAVAPTTVATATPVFYVNSATGNTANLMEARVANTPVWSMDASGNVSRSGSVSGSNWGKISAPTSIATATPAYVVDSLGVSNILEARAAATPQFSVSKVGDTTVAGRLLVTGTQDFTGASNMRGALTVASAIVTGTTTLTGITHQTGAFYAAGAVDVVGATTSGSLVVTGTTTLTGAAETTAGLTVGTFLDGKVAAAVPVVASTPIAPTQSIMLLSSAGAVDPGGIGAGSTNLRLLILTQTSAQAITLTEAGTLHLGAATRVLNQYDSITLLWNGSAWVEIAYTDN
jgi:hypothetical protein